MKNLNISRDIAEWCIEYNITQVAANSLLKVLQKYIKDLPKCIKTMKKVPKVNSDVIPMGEGFYTHFGIPR